jgi:(1->4)-alpha-D-glucan 1-alpha-D-glucosylmutase
MQRFVAAILDPRRSSIFLADLGRLQRVVARIGAVNSLGQTLVKLTAPGVPDIYQGNDLWDFSLVDPDNRRPVDYALRRRHLRQLQRAVEREGAAPLRRLARTIATDWTDGRIKQYVTWRALSARREHEDLFRDGAYLSLGVDGSQREHAFAYARELDEQQVIVVVPRLVGRLLEQPEDGNALGPLRFQDGAWKDTKVLLPDRPGRRYKNLVTGDVVETTSARAGAASGVRAVLPLDALLSDFPVTLLTRELS